MAAHTHSGAFFTIRRNSVDREAKNLDFALKVVLIRHFKND
jgi:hypothetical protein